MPLLNLKEIPASKRKC